MAAVAQDGSNTVTDATDDPAASSTSGQKKSSALALSNIPPVASTGGTPSTVPTLGPTSTTPQITDQNYGSAPGNAGGLPPNAGAPPAGAGAAPTPSGPLSVSAATAGTNSAAPAVSPSTLPTSGGVPYNPDGPAATAALSTFDNYSPLAGMSDAQKNAYWASQGVGTMAASTAGSDGTLSIDPAKNAALIAAGQADPATAGLIATQAAGGNVNQPGIDTMNTASAGFDADQAALDAANNAASTRAASAGFYNTPGAATATALPSQYYTPGSETGVNTINGVQSTPTNTPGVSTTTAPPGQDAGGNPLHPATVAAQSTGGSATTATPGGPSVSGPAGAPAVNTAPVLTPTDPANPLTAQTISSDPVANRFDIAQSQLNDTIKNTLEPQYQADARTIAAQSFGAGRGVSGMNRTSEGDLALQEGNQENQLASGFLNNALTGTIGDQQFNTNQADQQQGFQANQEQNAFNQATTSTQLQDQLTNSAASRAYEENQVGQQGSLAQAQLIVSQMQNGNATQAGQSAVQALTQAGIDASKMTPAQAVQAYLSIMGMSPPQTGK